MNINHSLDSSKTPRRKLQYPLEGQRGLKGRILNGVTTRSWRIGRLPSQCKSGTLAFYAKHAQKFCRSTAHLNLNRLYTPFLNELSPNARILDAGCGSGRDTKAFLTKGYQVKAIDFSPQLARMATKFTGQNCQVMSFHEMNFQDEFDGIWACASLLHTPHNEIGAVLDQFAKALKDKGVLFVSLKEGCGEKVAEDGRFFSYYALKEFTDLLTHKGRFKMIRAWRSSAPDSSGQTQSWLNFLAWKQVKTA